MVWRISFFVHRAVRTAEGWNVTGEAGLGPPRIGDRFSVVQHQPGPEETAVLEVDATDTGVLHLTDGRGIELRTGDILAGERTE